MSSDLAILFICGCLEPGADGVGDYTRRLAAEAARNGFSVGCLALNDRKQPRAPLAIEPIVDQEQDTSFFLWRFSSQVPWQQRSEAARKLVEEFKPQRISLQFVPTSFDLKGLPFRLLECVRHLLKACPAERWQIMFHELWLGVEGSDTFKRRVGGRLQQSLLLSLLRMLRGAVIHTHSSLYLRCLRQYGAEVRQLCLFGNIPAASPDVRPPLEWSDKLRVALHFGRFVKDPKSLANRLAHLRQLAEQEGRSLFFMAAGRGGPFSELSLERAAEVVGAENVRALGAQETRALSCLMAHADIGLARSGARDWEKSGTAIAMMEHGLPVLFAGGGSRLLEEPPEPYAQLIIEDSSELTAFPRRAEPFSGLHAVFGQFSESLALPHQASPLLNPVAEYIRTLV